MKVYFVLGKTPTVSKQRHPKLINKSRRNGAVKVFHPAAIKAMNCIADKQLQSN